MAGDAIPVYSKVQGKTVYVRGDQAQAYVKNDAAAYAKMQAEKRSAAKQTARKQMAQKPKGEVYGPPAPTYGPLPTDGKPDGRYYDESNDTVSESYLEWGIIAAGIAIGAKTGLAAIASIGSALGPIASNVDLNKLNHIFNNVEHNLKPLLDSFNNNMQNAYIAVQNAAQRVIDVNNYTGVFDSVENPIIVRVNDYVIQVGGRVVDGVFKIGTFFIK